MTKKPSSSRVHRDDDVPDDAFVGTIKRIIAWGQENTRQVTIGSAVILVIAAVAAWMIIQQRNLEASAHTRLAQVQQTVASGNTQLAIRDLQSYLDTFGSTDVADQARLTLADLLTRTGQPQQAIDALADLPSRLDAPFGLPAARLEAAALEQMGRHDDAISAYDRIAANARFPFQRREALADAARLELQYGSPEQAVDHLQRAVTTFDEGEAGRGYFEMWLAEARAQARAGQATAAPPPNPTDTAAG